MGSGNVDETKTHVLVSVLNSCCHRSGPMPREQPTDQRTVLRDSNGRPALTLWGSLTPLSLVLAAVVVVVLVVVAAGSATLGTLLRPAWLAPPPCWTISQVQTATASSGSPPQETDRSHCVLAARRQSRLVGWARHPLTRHDPRAPALPTVWSAWQAAVARHLHARRHLVRILRWTSGAVTILVRCCVVAAAASRTLQPAE